MEFLILMCSILSLLIQGYHIVFMFLQDKYLAIKFNLMILFSIHLRGLTGITIDFIFKYIFSPLHVTKGRYCFENFQKDDFRINLYIRYFSV